MTTLLSRLISTALLSDLDLLPFVGDNSTSSLAVSLSTLNRVAFEKAEPDYTTITPLNFPVFAEYSKPPLLQEGIDDTGLTLRGLLPIASSTIRETLAIYNEPETLLESRIICMQPTVDQVSFQPATIWNNGYSNQTMVVGGTLLIGNLWPLGLVVDEGGDPEASINFSCYLSSPTNPSEWPISMCLVNSIGVRPKSPLAVGNLTSPLTFVLVNHTLNDIPVEYCYYFGLESPSSCSFGWPLENWTITPTVQWIDLQTELDTEYGNWSSFSI
jgi:hypothetical protein